MKKWLFIALCAGLALALAGCSAGDPSSDNEAANELIAQAESAPVDEAELPAVDVSITEKMFIAQVNDIYVNADDYLGKTIELEGVFDSYPYTEAGDLLYTVIRYGPGCCGNDGNVGFEVQLHGDNPSYPANGDWVRAVGMLERYEEQGQSYLRLQLSRLEKLEVRGLESVTQ